MLGIQSSFFLSPVMRTPRIHFNQWSRTSGLHLSVGVRWTWGAYYTEKNEKWFCGAKWFFSQKVIFFPYNMKKKNIFVIKWFFRIFAFCIKTIFNVKWTQKKIIFKKSFWSIWHEKWFFFHIIRKKSHFLPWKLLFGQNDFFQMTFFRIIWLFSFGKKIHFSCKMTFLFPSV